MGEIVEVLVERIPRDTSELDHVSDRYFACFGCTRDGERRCREQSRALLEESRFAGLPAIVLAAPRGGLEGGRTGLEGSDKDTVVLNSR